MRAVLFLFVTLPALAGVIDGVARMAATGTPVAGAKIKVSSGEREFEATSDAGGRFRLTKIPVGRYTATGKREGFRQSKLRQPPVQIRNESDVKEMIVEFVAEISISGRVVDQERRPLRGIMVGLHSGLTESGNMVATGEKGLFSFFGLGPGEYLLPARPGNGNIVAGRLGLDVSKMTEAAPEAGERRVWPVTYFPGAADMEHAQRLLLTPGMAQREVEFVLRPVPAHPLTGRVVDGERNPVEARIVLHKRLPRPGEEIAEREAETDKDGRFQIENVAVGEWMVTAIGKQGAAFAGVQVAGPQGRPLELRLEAPFELAGRVTLPDGITAEQRKELMIWLRPMDMPTEAPVRSAPDAAGLMRVPDLHRGRYRVTAKSAAPGVYAASIKQGEQELLGQVVSVGPGSPPFQVTFREGRSRLSGQVEKGGEATVVVIPVDPVAFEWMGSQVAECDANGRFRMGGLAPGRYRVLAFNVARSEIRWDVERRLEGGVAVELKEGEGAALDLRLSGWPIPLF